MNWEKAVEDALSSGRETGRKYVVIGYRSLTGGWDWWSVPSGGITHGMRRTFAEEQRSLRARRSSVPWSEHAARGEDR